MRCYLKGRTYTQRLKTTNKQAAISQAKQFFHIKTAELYSDQVTVRYGARVIELAKGKSSIEIGSTDQLLPTLELIKQTVEAGESDAQIEAAALRLREGFGK